MIEPINPRLSKSAQCRLLSISRSSYYYAPVPETEETLCLMRVIDAAYLDMPWYGCRQMTRHLRREGHDVGRRRMRRLMARMGLAALFQRPRTSLPHPQHGIYPYLLRKLAIEQPNHVWCADVTYLPMRRGFLYLVAIMDWARCWPGGCPTPWVRTSALPRWRRLWPASASPRLQYRSGRQVHQLCLYPCAAQRRCAHQHGWPGPMDGQCIHRTAPAFDQVRMRLSQRLRNRIGAQGWSCPVDHLL